VDNLSNSDEIDEDTEENGQISQIDLRCSVACTRAGYIVLALAAIGFSLLHPLKVQKIHEALGRYVVLRINLSAAMGKLEEEPCWKQVLKSQSANSIDQLPFGKLLDVQCAIEKDGILVRFPQPTSLSDKNNTSIEILKSQDKSTDHQQNLPPGPPIGFRIWASIQALDDIHASLVGLGDGKVLAMARQSTMGFNYSIYRWAALIRTTKAATSGRLTGQPVTLLSGDKAQADIDPNFVPDISEAEIKSSLTLADIRKLAKTEEPQLAELEKVMGDPSKVSIPLTSIPVTIPVASTLTEAGILFSLMYFWLFQQEAQASQTFPAPGTLFSALNRSVGSRFLFGVMILIPPGAAILVAWRSLPSYTYYQVNWSLAVGTLATALVIAMTSKVLHNKKQL